MVEITEPTPAPISVPATPRNEAATAAVTAAGAPPQTRVRESPPAGFSSVTVVAVERVDEVRGDSGMTPDGSWAGRDATSSSSRTSDSDGRRVPAMPGCEAVHPHIALLHDDRLQVDPLHDELCQLLSVQECASQPAEVHECAVHECAVQECAVQSSAVHEWASQLPADDPVVFVQFTPRQDPPLQLVRAADAVAHAAAFHAPPKMSASPVRNP